MDNAWVGDIAIDAMDRVWFVTKYKLYVFNGQEWQFFDPSVVGAERWAEAISFDNMGRPWITALDKGIAVFQGQLKIGPLTKLIAAPPMKNIPEYELGPSSIIEPDDEHKTVKMILKYLFLALIISSGGIQTVRFIRDNKT